MNVNKAGYGGMDWVYALKGLKTPVDPEKQLASQTEEEASENVLEKTLSATFNTPTNSEKPIETVRRKAKTLAEKYAQERASDAVKVVKAKLADKGIDPVALGIASKDEWEGCIDPRDAEMVAKKAAVAYKESLSHAWEKQAMQPPTKITGFDPQTSRGGKIMSAKAMDDVVNAPSRVPLNANSIMDPNRIDKLASEPNAHDEAIAGRKKAALEKEAAEAEAQRRLIERETLPPGQEINAGKISKSGGSPAPAFNPSVPKNQLSIHDNLSGLSEDNLAEKLGALFTTRVPDNKSKTQAYNAERKAKIQGEKKPDKEWEKVSKPVYTKDLAKRLIDLWPDPNNEAK